MSVAHPQLLCHIASPMRERRSRDFPRSVLQDYFESLAETGGQPNQRLEKILGSYAEVQYRIRGGGHCSVCRAAVRHVLPVRVENADGSIADFECLCTRCLQAERVLSARVTMTVGKAVLVYTPKRSASPKTQKFKVNF
jgi:hypothetical protein